MPSLRSARPTRSVHAPALALGAVLLSAVPLAAADNPPKPDPMVASAAGGRRLAERFCSVCHVVDKSATGAVPVGPPPFAAIANKPGQTAAHIKGVLIQPHAPMPDLQLTNDEILGLLAYLQTLRVDQKAPPFAVPLEVKEPRDPEPG